MERGPRARKPGQLPISRRRLVNSVAVIGATGALGAGIAGARHRDSGPQEKCECIDDADAWGKYDFVIEKDDDGTIIDCYFEHTEGSDVVTITGWDDKDGAHCEPVVVYYEPAPGYTVDHVCSFGGTDNHDDPDPEWGVYVSDLVNPAGQRAAISNLVFCVAEAPDAFVGFQVDLFYGDDVIERFDPPHRTYSSEHRLLQALWSDPGDPDGRLEPQHFDQNTQQYEHCIDEGLTIVQDITIDSDTRTASACIEITDAETCSVADFGLASYGSPTHEWDPDLAPDQELYDYELTPDGDGCFTVDLPPTFI